MPPSCTVLIAAPDLLNALKHRTDTGGGDLLAFSDTDALRALEVIIERRPDVVALERLFAATPRGTALIKRIKADPSLSESEIRVVSHDADARMSPRLPSRGGGTTTVAAPVQTDEAPLDQIGTRRSPRQKVDVEVLVDANLASVVDLSTDGAQVVTAIVLKPNQRVRVTLSDDQCVLRLNSSVAWASFEIPPNGDPRYRAGLQFHDANSAAVDAYALRHRAP